MNKNSTAFGAPGIEPRWTSSAKDGIGTAYHSSSCVWSTLPIQRATLRVAQATQAVQGHNGFILEGHDFSGRMQGDGGHVALRFVTPGTYTSTLDHSHRSGTIVVR